MCELRRTDTRVVFERLNMALGILYGYLVSNYGTLKRRRFVLEVTPPTAALRNGAFFTHLAENLITGTNRIVLFEKTLWNH